VAVWPSDGVELKLTPPPDVEVGEATGLNDISCLREGEVAAESASSAAGSEASPFQNHAEKKELCSWSEEFFHSRWRWAWS
jgi:hypothetical protein